MHRLRACLVLCRRELGSGSFSSPCRVGSADPAIARLLERTKKRPVESPRYAARPMSARAVVRPGHTRCVRAHLEAKSI